MRLLERNSASEFSLTDDIIDDNEIPPYAILSHTWREGEEVTFQELTDGIGKDKLGYEKIRFCGEQAERDGLQYFWVDTCCINKTNNTELSEAINSMFRWYRGATRCYVYLSDVFSPVFDTHDQFSELPYEAALRKSRWFIRGWTLQELIAPRSVEFFCANRKRLGDKKSLEGQLQKITGIAVSALRGTPLSEFSTDERMSWAKNRETKREEDKVYSLLGIFDISMPVIYGEGKDNAFRRLKRELKYQLDELSTTMTLPTQSSTASSRRDKDFIDPQGSVYNGNSLYGLPYAADAPFNSFRRQHEPICLNNTRIDILQEIHTWADEQDERCIFWLNGLAGTGKSTIARTVARRYFEEQRLGASFFFTKGGGDVGHAGKFVTSIAVQLASSIPSLHLHISAAITERGNIIDQSLRDQWHQLVLRPLSKLGDRDHYSSYVLVVDALDECDDDNNIRIILQLLSEARSLRRVRLRIFLTSRPEIPVRYSFDQIPDTNRQDFILHSILPSIIDHDILVFLKYNLGLIGQEDGGDPSWPGLEAVQSLVEIASGLFIWAATACRFIREGFSPEERLCILLKGGNTPASPEEHLDGIYTTVLQNSIQPGYSELERQRLYDTLRKLLGSIVVLSSPLSVKALSRLLHTTKQQVDRTLKSLHAILDIPKDQKHPLRLHHPSFRDFLLNHDRCKDQNFWVDEKKAHRTLAESCIRLMSTSLKQDICDLVAPGILVSEVEHSRVDSSIHPEVQYACLYWVQHLQKSDTRLFNNDQVYQFLQGHLLHWLEALGWMWKTSEGILAISLLEAEIPIDENPDLYMFVQDAKRFALYNRYVIEQAPLQLYSSALVFAPERSIVRRQFEWCIPRWFLSKPRVQANWNAALQTLEGHYRSVRSVAFSPDGKQVVSGSDDHTVRLWDALTGATLQTLEGHSDSVNSVAFSHDSKQVVSGSDDHTVRFWDAVTGATLQTLEGHSDYVYSVAFSPDSKQVVSGSGDHTVRLWDALTRATLQTLEGHSDSVNSVTFSPDGKQVISGSDDHTVRLWDAVTGATLQTLEGHFDYVYSVAFSPDSKQVVSGSADRTVRLWDALTGATLQTLEGHSDSVNSVAFSHDGKQVVSGSADRIVRLWDAVTGAILQTLEGHSYSISSVAFSPDGKQVVSGSADRTVRLWDALTRATLQTLEGHSDSVNPVAFSPDGKQVVSGSWDCTVRLWDAVTGAILLTLEGHSYSISSVAFSPDSKQVVSGSWDHTVRLWDALTGAILQTFEGHSYSISSVAFSPDGKQVVSGSWDHTVRLWDAVTGAILQILEGHLGSVNSVAFSADGKKVVSGSKDHIVRLWDALTGATLQTLEGHSDSVNSVVFSPDGKQVVSGSSDNTVRRWDAVTGATLQTLKGYSRLVDSFAFSPDGKLEQALFVSDNWILNEKGKLLWLPPEYRETCTAVWNRTIVLGHSSGRISLFGFHEDCL